MNSKNFENKDRSEALKQMYNETYGNYDWCYEHCNLEARKVVDEIRNDEDLEDPEHKYSRISLGFNWTEETGWQVEASQGQGGFVIYQEKGSE